MKFRIHLHPDKGQWAVELKVWPSFWWTPVQKPFSSYYEAQEWAKDQGLHEAYNQVDTRTGCLISQTTQTETKKPIDGTLKLRYVGAHKTVN